MTARGRTAAMAMGIAVMTGALSACGTPGKGGADTAAATAAQTSVTEPSAAAPAVQSLVAPPAAVPSASPTASAAPSRAATRAPAPATTRAPAAQAPAAQAPAAQAPATKAPATRAPAPPPATAKSYQNCDAMHVHHPGGVALPGAVDKRASGSAKYTPTYSRALYEANTKSDRDKDGVACEQ